MDGYGNAIKLSSSHNTKNKTKKVFIALEVETEKEYAEVVKALKRGIYRGLDSSPFHIAPPNKVNIYINRA